MHVTVEATLATTSVYLLEKEEGSLDTSGNGSVLLGGEVPPARGLPPAPLLQVGVLLSGEEQAAGGGSGHAMALHD